jgi:hypothetical protein
MGPESKKKEARPRAARRTARSEVGSVALREKKEREKERERERKKRKRLKKCVERRGRCEKREKKCPIFLFSFLTHPRIERRCPEARELVRRPLVFRDGELE